MSYGVCVLSLQNDCVRIHSVVYNLNLSEYDNVEAGFKNVMSLFAYPFYLFGMRVVESPFTDECNEGSIILIVFSHFLLLVSPHPLGSTTTPHS